MNEVEFDAFRIDMFRRFSAEGIAMKKVVENLKSIYFDLEEVQTAYAEMDEATRKEIKESLQPELAKLILDLVRLGEKY